MRGKGTLRWVRMGISLTLAAASFIPLSGCHDKSVDADDPPRVIPYIEYLSTSYVDDYVYFSFGGDTLLAGGIYRYNPTAGGRPELVIAGALAGAISPCGDRMAYLTYLGDIRIVSIEDLDPYSPTGTVVVPMGPAGGPVSVRWRGCDKLLYSGEYSLGWGVYQVDLGSLEHAIVASGGRDATASLDGETLVYANRFLYMLRGDQDDSLVHLNLPQLSASYPSVSWSGSAVAYVGTEKNGPALYAIRLFRPEPLDDRLIAAWGTYPVWRRDEQMIYYVRSDSLHYRQIWLTDPQGTEHTQVLTYNNFYD